MATGAGRGGDRADHPLRVALDGGQHGILLAELEHL